MGVKLRSVNIWRFPEPFKQLGRGASCLGVINCRAHAVNTFCRDVGVIGMLGGYAFMPLFGMFGVVSEDDSINAAIH